MITLSQAVKALRASEDKAQEIGAIVSTIVVDNYGVPIALSRMDGALHISPRYAQVKAHTSAALGIPSGDLAAYAIEGKPYFGINTVNGGELTLIGGGVPVMRSGKVVGAVGVAGAADVSHDIACAQAAATLLM